MDMDTVPLEEEADQQPDLMDGSASKDEMKGSPDSYMNRGLGLISDSENRISPDPRSNLMLEPTVLVEDFYDLKENSPEPRALGFQEKQPRESKNKKESEPKEHFKAAKTSERRQTRENKRSEESRPAQEPEEPKRTERSKRLKPSKVEEPVANVRRSTRRNN